VVVRTEDVWLSADNSRYLAEHIPAAELLELPGVDHDPWVGDTEPVLQAVEMFLATIQPTAAAMREASASNCSMLATCLLLSRALAGTRIANAPLETS
jgi:hypothetical protein